MAHTIELSRDTLSAPWARAGRTGRAGRAIHAPGLQRGVPTVLTTVVLADMLVASRPAHANLTALVVDDEGNLLGAIGPRQFQAALAAPGIRAGQAMIPASELVWSLAGTHHRILAQVLARHGFALVRTVDGIGVVDACHRGTAPHRLESASRRGRSRHDGWVAPLS